MTTLDVNQRAVFARIADALVATDREHATAVDQAFQNLRSLDPDLAAHAIRILGTERLAARVFARRWNGPGTTFYAVLAAGQRESVVEALTRIRCGICG